ncbi:Per1-like protein [Guyanagaster necrorhizus]|uniref:Post-GPI attachment to proteins factor 3 n=1 Tax=Guyanagaster necrorhizus TaxID=856835 RepID=A0A9P8AYX5_9AGAR|nr:Per1-like protein [Guyanagaster necrorhizus MCA 3950]KAG7453108.1 Per1-like protein [Guyanagaster necrorhizus MCA 3950]
MKLTTFLPLLVAFPVQVLASWGDRSKDFQYCLRRCETADCVGQEPAPLSLSLRLTRWTCSDNCKYHCMHEIASRDIALGTKLKQYYGKWPFWRLGGVQEPASVAFSLLNFWAHVKGASRLRREVSGEHPMRIYYLLWAFASMNTWVWSSVFHTRDTPLTEKLDYFSAAFTILFALYFCVIRLFHLYAKPRSRLIFSNDLPRYWSWILWTSICIVAFVCHVTYLTLLPRFDYVYNIVFNSVVGMIHNLFWLVYSLPASISLIRRFPLRPKTYRPPFVGHAATLVFVTTAATGLELFDFPPWGRIIDAHSLWHLSTAVIAPFWYQFLVDDSRDESWREHRV